MTGMKETLGDTFYAERFPPHQRHSRTSQRAARSIAPRAPSIKSRVLEFIKAHPEGATDEQLIDAIGLSASTVRPRRIDLVEDGLIQDCRS
jgi:hypothetical protein